MSETLIGRRQRLMGPNVSTFYRDPVHVVRGKNVWLWDTDGRKYLDCYNNVAHVGHCHPKVVEAIANQAATLNTHTRYLHEGVLDYIERLTSKFDQSISQAIMVCSGSEANDIALRMAHATTGKTGIIAMDYTYHGNTTAVGQLSVRRRQIGGVPGHVRLVPAPSSTAPVGGTFEGQSEAFARNIAHAVVELEEGGYGFSGIIFCPAFANEGLPSLPKGFLDPAIGVVRRARGLILCDEIQSGFGRLGSHWWGHEKMGFVPDVVTLGKSLGNGHPIAAVLARPDVITEFREAFGYFNTFGGNPVSAAAAMATLDVIEAEGLVENADATGKYLLKRLQSLNHPYIAQARGSGLFLGVEFVDVSGKPATKFTGGIVEAMRENGILLGKFGQNENILKIRPPLPFSLENADQLVDTLTAVLEEGPSL